MKSYADGSGIGPDFEVSYRFLAPQEGGRQKPPFQHTRWDFLYEGDDSQKDGISMIWPEAVDSNGVILPEGPIPMSGTAFMFVVVPERRKYHIERLRPGARGFFVEGPHRVAECTVTRILYLHDNPRTDEALRKAQDEAEQSNGA
jgi:hypothetical protein